MFIIINFHNYLSRHKRVTHQRLPSCFLRCISKSIYTIFYCLCQMKKPQKSAEIWGYFLKGGVRNFYLYNASMIVPIIIIVNIVSTSSICLYSQTQPFQIMLSLLNKQTLLALQKSCYPQYFFYFR